MMGILKKIKGLIKKEVKKERVMYIENCHVCKSVLFETDKKKELDKFLKDIKELNDGARRLVGIGELIIAKKICWNCLCYLKEDEE